jgi:hypothetical protein
MFVAAISLSGLLLLSGCDERPYPEAANSYAAPPKAPPPPPLAGAPAPPPQTYAASPPVADASSPARRSTPPAIVAMAPIPNPGDPGSEGYYPGRGPGHRVHAHLFAAPPAYAAAPPPPPPPPQPPAYADAEDSTPPPAPPLAKKDYARAQTPQGPVKPSTPPKGVKPAPPANSLDRPTRLAALQSALTHAISKGALLTAQQRFTANKPAGVSLTVPATFADTLRNEAQKNGLSDAAASVNLNVGLSGDGFSVTPDETQSQPLTVGRPTEFRWTVTAQPGAKGPLHAEVGADLLGAGSDTLALGSVQKQAGFGVKSTPRMVGAAILVLILALVVMWLARGRGSSRPASARRAARDLRPLDMGTTKG